MRITRSFIQQLCILAIIESLIAEFKKNEIENTPELSGKILYLKSQFIKIRSFLLSRHNVSINKDGYIVLDKKSEKRFNNTKDRMLKELAKILPPKTIDLKLWINTSILIVDEFIKKLPEHIKTEWQDLLEILCNIYEDFDNDISCQDMIKEGVNIGLKILKTLES